MSKKLLVVVLSLLFLIPSVKSTDITDCADIGSGGEYVLQNDIYAQNYTSAFSCLFINSDNVSLNLNNFKIIRLNDSLHFGVLVNTRNNVKIINGIIQNFTYGLSFTCNPISCNNSLVNNIQLLDNSVGLTLINVSNSSIQVAIDQPISQTGIYAVRLNGVSINAFSRASTFGLLMENAQNSLITGRYDTNVIITTNESVFGGQFLSTLTLGLIPPTIFGTKTVQTQSKGIAIFSNNSFNTIYRDIYANGLVQGLAIENSQNNTFGKIELPLSNKYAQYMGGLYLGKQSINNYLCDIKGRITDDCGQILLSSTCPQKNNVYYDTCLIFDNNTYGQKQSISTLYLIPLIEIPIPQYAFLSFIFTPFFLIIIFCCGISSYIAIKTKPMFGLYSLIIFVFLASLVSLNTVWFGLIFITIMGYFIYRQQKGGETTT